MQYNLWYFGCPEWHILKLHFWKNIESFEFDEPGIECSFIHVLPPKTVKMVAQVVAAVAAIKPKIITFTQSFFYEETVCHIVFYHHNAFCAGRAYLY